MNHAPDGYRCPFCAIVSGVFGDHVLTSADEVVLREELVTAFVSSHQWPRNRGHVLVVPNAHIENLYELSDDLALPIHRVVKRVAIALKAAYSCPGVSTRQHNEPAGGQDVWHFHVHVCPRYAGDHLYRNNRAVVPTGVRLEQAARLREALELKA